MSTLKEWAAARNLYTAEDIPAKYRSEHGLPDAGSIPAFFQDNDRYECAIFYDCRTQDAGTDRELHYIESGSTLLLKYKNDSTVLALVKGWRDNGKYSILPYHRELSKYRGISHYTKEKALSALHEPNKIGVFTDKKVGLWFSYSEKYIEVLDFLLNDLAAKNAEVQKKINVFIHQSRGEAKTFDSLTTYVKTKHFTVTFKHDKTMAYLSTEIEFTGSLQDIVDIETGETH